MVAPADFTWDFVLPGTIAAAAGLDALGGAQLVDDAKYPPIPPQMPYAAQLNQWALQLAGMNRVIAGLDLEIGFSGGVPSIVNAMAMSTIITTTWAQANIAVDHTGTGIITLTWPAGALPPPRGKPRAAVVADGSYLQPIALPQSNGVQVKIRDNTGALVDANFAVTIF